MDTTPITVDTGHRATFVLSTGRCGTQWLAHALTLALGNGARVEHEPLDNGYQPRALLAGDGLEVLPPRDRTRIEQHLAGIEQTLRERDYVETGFPCWSALPYLLRRFAGRMRIVHLVRHPVPTAYSWQAHGAYVPPLLPHLPEKILLHPADVGTAHPEYAERWPALRPFARCLYFWLEVQTFALELEKRTGAPWLRLHYEEMFTSAGLQRLGAFLGLEQVGNLVQTADEIVDRFRFCVMEWTEPSAILGHPCVIELARQFGYARLPPDVEALKRRYAPALV